jgi:hypothetical protein
MELLARHATSAATLPRMFAVASLTALHSLDGRLWLCAEPTS